MSVTREDLARVHAVLRESRTAPMAPRGAARPPASPNKLATVEVDHVTYARYPNIGGPGALPDGTVTMHLEPPEGIEGEIVPRPDYLAIGERVNRPRFLDKLWARIRGR